jgi:hypothetical protein
VPVDTRILRDAGTHDDQLQQGGKMGGSEKRADPGHFRVWHDRSRHSIEGKRDPWPMVYLVYDIKRLSRTGWPIGNSGPGLRSAGARVSSMLVRRRGGAGRLLSFLSSEMSSYGLDSKKPARGRPVPDAPGCWSSRDAKARPYLIYLPFCSTVISRTRFRG